MFDLPAVIVGVSRYLTLKAGAIVALVTPAGVGPVPDGWTVEVAIEGTPPLGHRLPSAG